MNALAIVIALLATSPPPLTGPQAKQFAKVRGRGAIAMFYQANGFYSEAVRWHRMAAADQPDDERWVYLHVLARESMGEIEPAVDLLERTVAINRNNAAAWYRLGQAHFKQGRLEKANHALVNAVQSAAGSDTGAYATLTLARIALRRGEIERAQQLLEDGIQKWPSLGPLHRTLARVYRKIGREEDAQWHQVLAATVRRHGPPPEPMLDELIKQSRSRDVLLERALMAGRAGRLDQKRLWLKRGLRFYPNDERLLNELNELDRAETKTPVEIDAAQFDEGRKMFMAVCAVCHDADGRGQDGKAPPLIGSTWLRAREDQVVRIVLDGVRGEEGQYDRQMPSLRALADDQVAAVLNYARRRLGDTPSNITAATVARIREQTMDRSQPWSRAELEKLTDKQAPQ